MSTNGNSRKFLNRTRPDGGGRGQSRSNRPGCRLFGTVSKERGASISSCHAPEAVRAAGANPIQLEQIRVTGLVQVRRSFFHHHGVRRRLYQGGSGRLLCGWACSPPPGTFQIEFPAWFGLAMAQSMESGCRRHLAQLDSQKNVQNPWLRDIQRGSERKGHSFHQTKKSANPANESGLRSRRGHTLSVSG